MSRDDEVQHNFRRSITCIKFPGIVKDSGVSKAIQTFGGHLGLSQAVSNKNQRLELNFNPSNPYHKPVFGDRTKANAILIKVKKSAPDKPQVVGVVRDYFSFKSMCDFQFLPPSDPSVSVFPLDSLPNPDEILNKEVPTGLYLPAASLSRMDTVSGYSYSNRSNIVGPRPSRKNHTQRIPFSLKSPFPSSPLPGALRTVELRKLNASLAQVKKLFDERPIWTRSALEITLPVDRRKLGVILPCIGFFFQGGPWRLTWCRHGFDPRTEPTAGRWQTIEFRAQAFELRKHLKLKAGDKNVVKFKEGVIPPQINCLYQLVDIELMEVEALLSVPHYKVCHEKNGWLVPGTMEKVRKLIDEKANETVIQRFGLSAPEAEEEEAEESDDSLVVLDYQNAIQSADETDSDSDFKE